MSLGSIRATRCALIAVADEQVARRQTQFRGKKRSVSDLVTCDPYKATMSGVLMPLLFRIGLDAFIGYSPDSFAIGRRLPKSDRGCGTAN
jgi:hypothetical protein